MASPPSPPPHEYTTSVPFEPDEETQTLGDRLPTTITQDEQRVLLHKARTSRVSLDVVALAHGTFGGAAHPATLLALRFQFSYPHQSTSRLTSAELNISFQPAAADRGASSSKFPTVRRFSPTSIRDTNPTSATVTRTTAVGASASVGDASGVVPLGVGLSAQNSTEVSFTADFGCEAVGEPWTSDEAYDAGCEGDNAVTWYVKENEVRPAGIPRELRAVVVVERGDGEEEGRVLLARVKAKVRTGWGMSLLGKLFPGERPLVIGEGVEFGEPPAGRDFEALSAEELGRFAGFGRR
ncbi:hypothetical protein QBC39DRAFT_386550 [Podospora conica]|nr:hypothetical protein QBC39DRAFT_386550 [Schizothecium conicum]